MRDPNADVSDITKPTNPKDVAAAIAGRVPMHLMPDSAVIAGNMAFLEGALKYGAYNWRVAGVQATVYLSALRRHLAAWYNGEDMDDESGLPHLWKALSCLVILIDANQVGCLKDDRPVVGEESGMLAALKKVVQELMAKHPDPKGPYTQAEHGVEARVRADVDAMIRAGADSEPFEQLP